MTASNKKLHKVADRRGRASAAVSHFGQKANRERNSNRETVDAHAPGHVRTNVRREHQAPRHARTSEESTKRTWRAHPAVGIASTEPGGLARPRKTICKLKRFVNDLERTTDILCMVCAHCGHDHRTENCSNICKLCQVVGHRPKSANCQFHVCSKCNTVGHSARACNRYPLPMVCAHCGHDHRTSDCPNFCKLCEVVGHRQKSANCQFHVGKKCNTVGHSARACKAPKLQATKGPW